MTVKKVPRHIVQVLTSSLCQLPCGSTEMTGKHVGDRPFLGLGVVHVKWLATRPGAKDGAQDGKEYVSV